MDNTSTPRARWLRRLRASAVCRHRFLKLVILGALLVVLSDSCVRPIKSLYPPAAGEPTRTIRIVSHGWHTGIVLNRADMAEAQWAVVNDFPRADGLEFGWGDAGYYPSEKGGAWLATKAVCWPTPSVLHVAPIHGEITNTFPRSEIVQIELSEAGFKRLSSFINREFSVTATGELIPVAPGLYENGHFYQARSKFYFCKTCNYWTASALREAGYPIRPLTSVTAGKVLSKTKKFGRTIQEN